MKPLIKYNKKEERNKAKRKSDKEAIAQRLMFAFQVKHLTDKRSRDARLFTMI